ncbi:hypothetical protein L100_12473 [Elizabethkingia meningoseptica ATCC 13253 = NBRC 12535]|nr:hypothetical protein L100_12473 [Elizabethkingia meningoseptica ATCC 13253 = NBRC 12535]
MEQPFFMKLKLYIFIAMKRFINIILLVLVLGIIFVPGVKVFIQSSLMKVGFFQTKFKRCFHGSYNHVLCTDLQR